MSIPGYQPLYSNSGHENSAYGYQALYSNSLGTQNTAVGHKALYRNVASANAAVGYEALISNTTGISNIAIGDEARLEKRFGGQNTACGVFALGNNTTGSNNIALGFNAGDVLTTGNSNIDIGNESAGTESNTIRIGSFQTRTFIAGISGVAVTGATVVVNANGQLGVTASSSRFKDKITAMDKASEALFALKPVEFRYKKDIDPAETPQFGLVAEDVEKVNPDLIVRDIAGKPYTVRYDAVNAMLLNEFLKEHKKTEKLEATVASLIATVKEQAAQIQKVSAQLELSKPAAEAVVNDR